jgi:hypothetical protein
MAMHYIPYFSLRCNEETEIIGVDDGEMEEFAYDYVGMEIELGPRRMYSGDTNSITGGKGHTSEQIESINSTSNVLKILLIRKACEDEGQISDADSQTVRLAPCTYDLPQFANRPRFCQLDLIRRYLLRQPVLFDTTPPAQSGPDCSYDTVSNKNIVTPPKQGQS